MAGDFSVSAKVRVLSLAAAGAIIGSNNNGFGLRVQTNGTVVSGKVAVSLNTASTGTVAAFTEAVIGYTRSGTTGTYYLDGIAAGTITDSQDYTAGVAEIGSLSGGASLNIIANFKWARVYNVALTAPQMLADANGTQQTGCIENLLFTGAAKLATSVTATVGNNATINSTGDLGARISGERDLVQLTAAKQPVYLAWAGSNYGYFNGVAGNFFTAPDSVPLSITGDITIDALVTPADRTPGTATCLVGKEVGDPNRSYWMEIDTGGTISLHWTTTGSIASEVAATSTAATSLADGTAKWLRATLDADNGAAGKSVKFYTSDDGATWVQLGSTVTTAGTTSIADTTAVLSIGARGAGGGQRMFTGKVGRARIYAGFNGAGTLAFDFNPATYTSGTTFADSSANAATITLNGGATIVTASSLYFDGSNDYMKAAAFSLAQPETVFFVGKQVTWTINDGIYDGNALDTMQLAQSASSPKVSQYAGAEGFRLDFPVKTSGIISAVFNGTSGSIRLDRGTITTQNVGTATPNGFTLGAKGTPTAYGNIVTNEVAIYSAALTTAQQDSFIWYSDMKWALGF